MESIRVGPDGGIETVVSTYEERSIEVLPGLESEPARQLAKAMQEDAPSDDEADAEAREVVEKGVANVVPPPDASTRVTKETACRAPLEEATIANKPDEDLEPDYDDLSLPDFGDPEYDQSMEMARGVEGLEGATLFDERGVEIGVRVPGCDPSLMELDQHAREQERIVNESSSSAGGTGQQVAPVVQRPLVPEAMPLKIATLAEDGGTVAYPRGHVVRHPDPVG